MRKEIASKSYTEYRKEEKNEDEEFERERKKPKAKIKWKQIQPRIEIRKTKIGTRNRLNSIVK